MKFNLKVKLILSIFLVIFIFGGTAVVSIFKYTKKSVFELQKENLIKLTEDKAAFTNNIFNNVSDVLHSASVNSEIIQYLQTDQLNKQEASILRLFNLYKINEYFDVVYLMDSNGTTLVSTDESFVNKNYSFRNYFKKSLSGESAIDVSLGVTSKKLGYYFSAPISDVNSNILGVLVIKIKPEIIDKVSDYLYSAEDSHIMILDKDGIVVYSDLEERLYKSIGLLSDTEKQVIESERRYENVDIQSLQYQMVKDKLFGLRSVEIFDIYDEKDQEEEFISIATIPDTDFYLMIEESVEQYISFTDNIATILSLIVLLTALVSILIMSLFINNFLKPIKLLRKAAQRISSGDLSYRVSVNTGDEFEDLGISFNSMANKMEKNIKNIEKEVSKRTKRLEELNSHMIGRELKMIELKNMLKNKK